MSSTSNSTASSGGENAPKRRKRPPKFAPLLLAGWAVIPWAYRDGNRKAPLVSGYTGKGRERADRDTVKGWAKQFPDCNPGIVPPNDMIVLDVDGSSHGEGVHGLADLAEFENEFGALPPTGHIFHGYDSDGKPNPEGSRLYRMPESVLDEFVPGNVHGKIGTGVDIVAPWIRFQAAPGSVHKTGEVYEYADADGNVGSLPGPDAAPLLSERQARGLLKGKVKTQNKPLVPASKPLAGKARVDELIEQTRQLAALPDGETLLIESKERGWQNNVGFYTLACALIRVTEDREKAKVAFLSAADDAIEQGYDVEREWTNAEAAVDAEKTAYSVSVNVEPYAFAEEMLDREFRNESGVLTLRFGYDDRKFWLWDSKSGRYRLLTEDEVQAIIAGLLAGAMETSPDGEVRPVKVKTKTWNDIVSSMRLLTLTSPYGAGSLLPSKGGVPFRNGWLNVETRKLLSAGPERDIRWVVPIDYAPGGSDGDDVWAAFKATPGYVEGDAEKTEKAWQGFLKAESTETKFSTAPLLWLWFLSTLGWLPDTDEYRLLRQWYGYVLSGSLEQEKALMMVGPKRAGKGTILRVAKGLLGDGAVGTQIDKFEERFGLENLIGAGLATVGDARFSGGRHSKMSAKLLSVIAGDEVSVDVKYGKPVDLTLGCRLMVATNTLPRIIDSSDALPSRFVFLKFTRSFYGVEDKTLKKRLSAGLDKIARWALAGLDDLNGLGSFTETAAGREQREQMERICAPVRAFVEDCCALDPNAKSTNEDVFRAYLAWAEHTKVRFRLSEQELAQELLETFPGQIENVNSIRRGSQTKRGKRGIKVVHTPELDFYDY